MADHCYDPSRLIQSFGAIATTYDAGRIKLIPCFHQFYAAAVALLPFAPDSKSQVLDLGAGTGLLSAWVLEQFPQTHLTLIDLTEAMLELAKIRLAQAQYAPKFIVGDYSTHDLGGPYDAIISSLSIHHLDDERKRQLFARIHQALVPGGIFVNGEQVRGPTETLERDYFDRWWDIVCRQGFTAEELAAAKHRTTLDRHVSLDTQMDWLRQIGFADVDVWFKEGRFAVYSGRKS